MTNQNSKKPQTQSKSGTNLPNTSHGTLQITGNSIPWTQVRPWHFCSAFALLLFLSPTPTLSPFLTYHFSQAASLEVSFAFWSCSGLSIPWEISFHLKCIEEISLASPLYFRRWESGVLRVREGEKYSLSSSVFTPTPRRCKS